MQKVSGKNNHNQKRATSRFLLTSNSTQHSTAKAVAKCSLTALHCCSPQEGSAESPLRGAQCEPCIERTAFWAGFPPQWDSLSEILVLPKSLGEPPHQPSD